MLFLVLVRLYRRRSRFAVRAGVCGGGGISHGGIIRFLPLTSNFERLSPSVADIRNHLLGELECSSVIHVFDETIKHGPLGSVGETRNVHVCQPARWAHDRFDVLGEIDDGAQEPCKRDMD